METTALPKPEKPITNEDIWEALMEITRQIRILQESNEESGGRFTMLLSQASLARDWDTPEEDEAWAAL